MFERTLHTQDKQHSFLSMLSFYLWKGNGGGYSTFYYSSELITFESFGDPFASRLPRNYRRYASICLDLSERNMRCQLDRAFLFIDLTTHSLEVLNFG